MILVLSNADTELLALRTILHRLPEEFPAMRAANPDRLDGPPAIDDVEVVVIRLLGGRASWEEPFDALRDACLRSAVPFVAVGGEATPDPELAALSTVPTGTATEVHGYFAAGGPTNLENLLRFLADTVLLHGFGFDPPSPVPMVGIWDHHTGQITPTTDASPGSSGPTTVTGEADAIAPTTGALPGTSGPTTATGDADTATSAATHGPSRTSTTAGETGDGDRADPVTGDPAALPPHGHSTGSVGAGTAGIRRSVAVSGDTAGREREADERRARVGVVFYRAHLLAGNTQFVGDLCRELERAGVEPVAVFCYSLRPDSHGRVPALELCREQGVDALVTCVLAMGSSSTATRAGDGGEADGGEGAWEVPQLAELGVPVLQAPSCNRPRDEWLDDEAGLSPLDVASGVAIPEFDGRIIGPAFAFKETVDDGGELGTPVVASRTDPDRIRRVAGLAARLARLRHTPAERKRVAVVLSAYPTKRSRLGNAVGLDTPASVIRLLQALQNAGYQVDGIPADGDSLMATLADRLTYERPKLTPRQSELAVGRLPVDRYIDWFATLPKDARAQVEAAWGPPPGEVYLADGAAARPEADRAAQPNPTHHQGQATTERSPDVAGGSALVFPGLELGNVLVTIQPPRGFGSDPIGTYHAPDVPPPHHYLAFYRWLDEVWGADAVVHVGKHGTLEWLPGKANALSGACFPDAALGDLPFVYPFVVNDPGEGTQAKRRTHAVVVDHLVPPMTRAETYDELARLEQLLDTYAQAQAMDPAKLPALRQQVWDLLVEAEIHRDLGLEAAAGSSPTDAVGDDAAGQDGVGELHASGRRPAASGSGPVGSDGDAVPDADTFDDVVLHVDVYLCALKDAQIRGGLHILGEAPQDEALVDLVLGITRLPQGGVPSLRQVVADELGIDLAAGRRTEVDQVEAECRRRIESLAANGWTPPQPAEPPETSAGTARNEPLVPKFAGDSVPPSETSAEMARIEPLVPKFREVERWVGERLVPALRRTPDEIGNLLAALDGRYVPSGPSGAPTRGGAHVLPTGRNFYSVDPKGLPSPLSWEVGRALADAVVERHVDETGEPPRTVGLVLWGTAAMRTGGDDAAQALALLGVRPTWEPESGRVTGLEPIPLAELGRPRVDVTLRISGFFRDAFPHLVALLDDAVALAASLDDEDAAQNPIRAGGTADPRIWGPPPGGYGSGILPVIERGSWRTDADLAEVYLAWSGFAYGRHRFGEPQPEAMRRRFAAIEVAVKNQDNREHDIFDSDDYLQDHGGMVAAVRALSGRAPRAWFGDTADPASPTVRSLAEEAARVVRSRVLNPRWIDAMRRHGYKGAFELAATVDYLFGYDATARVVEDWMYERVTEAYVADPNLRAFFAETNPWALRAIAERLLEAERRGMWSASDAAHKALVEAVLEAEGWEEMRPAPTESADPADLAAPPRGVAT